MVKLAEARTKERYTLVPRGKALYTDGDRFGTKMLEKMGWTAGKGLGANEDGCKDFVRLRYKNDIKGLGYEARDDQWTQHETNFNGLLKNLNDESKEASGDSDGDIQTMGFGFSQNSPKAETSGLKTKISGESLEEKSKSSRARVHYKKFTRGKDLTKYSEKDLANIFGKKSLDQENDETTVQENTSTITENKLNEEIFQNSTLSVHDYFKEKMKARKKQSSQATNGIEETEVNHVEEEPKKKKKKSKMNDENVEIMTEETVSKKKKKKNKEQEVEILNEEITEAKKSKKEKKRKNLESIESEKSSEMEEPEVKKSKKEKRKNKESVIKEEPTASEIEHKISKKGKKKNKESTEDEEMQKSESNKEECDIEKVKKKKKKPCEEFKTENIEEINEEQKNNEKSINKMEDSEVVESTLDNLCKEKPKKKKNVNIEENQTQESSPQEICQEETKKKKKKVNEENHTLESGQQQICQEETKKKKKKKNATEEEKTHVEENKQNEDNLMEEV